MMIAAFDPSALATWVVGGITVLTMVGLAGLGAYLGSVRSVNAIRVAIVENHGETMTRLGTLETNMTNMHGWVENIADGNTPHIAEIKARLNEHGQYINDHGRRIGWLEIEHAKRSGSHCEEKPQC